MFSAPPPPRTPHSSDGPTGVTRLRRRPEFDRLFDVLADVERLRLLEALDPSSRPAGELAFQLGWTRDAVVKQLKLLERTGLVASAQVGRRLFYGLTSAKLSAALAWSSDLWRMSSSVRLDHAEELSPHRLAAVAAALRAPGRRDMLECMCRGGPISQSAAALDCSLSQGLASRGLAQLVEAGLVTVDATGRHHRYMASPRSLAALVRWLHAAVLTAERAEAQERRLREARDARAAERRRCLEERAGLKPSTESAHFPSAMSDVAAKRSRRRGRQPSPSELRHLDGVFAVFADEDDCKLASAVCEGVVTGVELAAKLGWRQDKVSRRLIRLAEAGVVERRQAGPCVRATPIVTGLGSAQAWIEALLVKAAFRPWVQADPKVCRRRCEALADRARRSLMEHVCATPGATQAELIRSCGFSQPVASRGLARLLEEKLVEVGSASGPARYVVGVAAIEELWAWAEMAKAKLIAGRVTASRGKVPPPQAHGGASAPAGAPSPASRTAPLPPVQANDRSPDSPQALKGDTTLSATSPSPPAALSNPRANTSTGARAPNAPLKKIAGISVDDPRPGQCFVCKDGSLVLLLSFSYGEFEYARRAAAGAPVTKGKELRHRLVASFTMAVDPAAFPKERIPR